MKTQHRLLIGTLGVALLASLVWFFQHPKAENPLGAGVQMTMDSLVITQPEFKAAVDSVEKKISTRRSALENTDVHLAQDVIYAQADSQLLREAKNAKDSLTAALTLVGSLTTQNHDLLDKITLLEKDTVDLRGIIVRDSARLDAVTRLNSDIATAVRRGTVCRVAFVVPCPSRAEAFVLGSALTLVAEIAINARK